jgi:gliding motility-associated-like protein
VQRLKSMVGNRVIFLFKGKFIIFLFQLLFSFTLSAQSYKFEWVKNFGQPINNTNGVSMALDSNKSVIVVGNFSNTVDFNSGSGVFNQTSNGASQDIFITEYDTAGNFVWAKQIGGTQNEIVKFIKTDKNSDLIIVGFFQGTVDFDPGPDVFNITASSVSHFILKLSNNGDFIWAKSLQVSGLELVDVDESNNIIVAGAFGGTVDFDPGPATFMATTNIAIQSDMFVVKLDNNGIFIWMKQIKNLSNSATQQSGLESDFENNIYFTGNFTSTMDFDPGVGLSNLTSNGLDDIFILKLDASGNFVWIKQIGSIDSDRPFGMEVDKNGNVFTTGEFLGTVDFDPNAGIFNLVGIGYVNAFISKLTKDGNFVYAKSLDGLASFGQGVAIDNSDNIYISGGYDGLVDFDPGVGVFTAGEEGDLFTLKLDNLGNFKWVAAYLSPDGFFQSIYSDVKVDIFKNVYFTGFFPVTVDFDPNPSVYNVTPNDIAGDAYIHKLSQCKTILNTINASDCKNYVLNGTIYSASGTYYQTLTNSVGCDSIIQLNLTLNRIINSVSTATCKPYNWNGIILNSSGIYKDTFNLPNGCDSIVILNLTIAPIISNLSLSSCGSYDWNGTIINTSGFYTKIYNLPNGCDSTVNLNLIINEKPIPNLGKDTSICRGKVVVLNPGVFNSYEWNNNTTASTLNAIDTGIYWVKVTNSLGCFATDSIYVASSTNCLPISIPNVFTPNSDNINDAFKPIINIPVDNYQMTIFNRWGEKVFVTKDYSKGWDGKYKNEKQNIGTFVYMIEFKTNNVQNFYKGTFMLLR